MTDPTNWDAVHEFIARYLPSIDHLDALLLLARDGSRSWTSRQASDELHGPLANCEKALDDLAKFGLAEFNENNYRYVTTETMRAVVRQLEHFNREQPVSLIRAIYRQPPSARRFSDAFRLRRAEDDNG